MALRSGSLALLPATGIFCLTLIASIGVAGVRTHAAQGERMDAAAHKQMMNDASDAQEDFRFALTDKDQKAAVEALGKLERFMGQTEAYWTAKKSADGVKLAKQARAEATQALAAAKANDISAAQESFDKMGATCNACHELHLEKP